MCNVWLVLKITNYQNAHDFLRDSWEEKRKKNPSFSLRSWAKQLGMASHAPLNLMLNGKRTISKKHIPALIQSLGLASREGLYLETLIEYNQSKTAAEKQMYFSRLRDLAPTEPLQAEEIESFKFLGDPIHCLILEMTQLRDFRPDPKWIQSRLRMSSTSKQIEEAIERLLNLGLLQKDSKRGYKKTHRFLSSRPDIADLGSQAYHRAVSALAAELVSEIPITDREYNGYTTCIRRESLPRAKKLLREFVQKFLKEVEIAPGEGEDTYQLNLQFFPVTQNAFQGDNK